MGDVLFGTLLGLGGRFNLLRSYVRGFATDYVPSSVSYLSGRVWQIDTTIYPGNYPRVMEWKPEFFNWNSNTYTVDWIWENFYDSNPGGGHYSTYPLYVEVHRRPSDLALYIGLFSHIYTTIYYMDIPPPPPGWWSGSP